MIGAEYIGEEWLVSGNPSYTTYLSIPFELSVFKDEDECYTFVKHIFKTNNPATIELIEANKFYDIEIFKDAFPSYVSKYLDEREQELIQHIK